MQSVVYNSVCPCVFRFSGIYAQRTFIMTHLLLAKITTKGIAQITDLRKIDLQNYS